MAGQRAVQRGDGVAVRVKLGVAELGGDALFEPLGDEVFEALGLLVHLVPGVAEDLVKKCFEQPMVANDFERAFLSGLGKLHAVVLLVHHQGRFKGGKLLQHVGHRGCGDGEIAGDLGARDLALFASAELKDCLEVVVDGFAARDGSSFCCGRLLSTF